MDHGFAEIRLAPFMMPSPEPSQPKYGNPRWSRRLAVLRLVTTFGLLLWWPPAPGVADEGDRGVTVGMRGHVLGQFLPGSEVEPRPIEDRKTPIVLRITEVFPRTGGLAYDLEYYGLDPGTYDLKDYLRRKDGSTTDDLPALPVAIHAVRPPGQVLPNELDSERLTYFGGYRLLMVLVSVAWTLGLVGIVVWMVRRRRNETVNLAMGTPAVSLADRLRPIVQDALDGKLSQAGRAELERTLLAFWRRQLALENLKASEAIVTLRQHPEAGELLRKLETWLHRPGTSGEVDVAGLLRPYQDLPADALEISHNSGDRGPG